MKIVSKHIKKKGRTFHWSDQCQRAFEQLKTCLTSPPVLGHPNLQQPFTVYTDDCDTGLDAVLTQRREQGMEEVICEQKLKPSRNKLLSDGERMSGRCLGTREMATLPGA